MNMGELRTGIFISVPEKIVATALRVMPGQAFACFPHGHPLPRNNILCYVL